MFNGIPKSTQIPNACQKYSGQPFSFSMCRSAFIDRLRYWIVKVMTLLGVCLCPPCCLVTSLSTVKFLYNSLSLGHICLIEKSSTYCYNYVSFESKRSSACIGFPKRTFIPWLLYVRNIVTTANSQD